MIKMIDIAIRGLTTLLSLFSPRPLKKVASLRDPCPESPKMIGHTLHFISGKPPRMGGFAAHFENVLGMNQKELV